MEFKLFKSAEIVALKQNQKWSLFHYVADEKAGEPRLNPVSFAQDVKILEVNEQYKLIVTSEKVYSFSGEEICEHSGDVKIANAGSMCIVSSVGRAKKFYDMQLIVWNGEQKLFETFCTDYRYGFGHLVLNHCNVWSLYGMDGTVIDEGAFQAVDVEICRDLLVAKRVGDNSLYSFTQVKFIKDRQTKIACSHSCNLALCAQMGSDTLDVYSNGKWHVLPGVEEFDILEGMESLFYIKRNGKYFLYEDDMTRFMQHLYPDGVDFVACNDEGVLLIINNGIPQFYNRSE